MRPDYADLAARRLALPLTEGPDKVTTAAEAIRRLVVPGQTIYLSTALGRPHVCVREMIRQWWGRSPAWTVVSTGLGSPWTALALGGLIRRLVTTFIGEGYPMPAPQRLLSAAIVEGRLDVQNWSMLTLPLRLLAGALGVPFLPTRSLVGSSMETDNARDGDFVAAPDPFGGDGRVGLVRALVPDLALVHAWAADRAGNVLTTAPLNEGFYGAMAARQGAIVTVERIVPTEFIRRHAALVRLPAQYVAAVVEAPLGSHPGAMYGMGVPGLDGYAEDLEFILDVRQAFRERTTAEAWIREWILEPEDHAAYVAKLGASRPAVLRERADPLYWARELETLEAGLLPVEKWTPIEAMVAVAARVIAEKVRARGYRSCLAGVGNSHLAAWLAASELQAAGVDFELVAEAGMIGYAARPADPFVFAFRNLPTSKMLCDIVHALGIVTGGADDRTIGALAAGQVDRRGNLNSTIVPGRGYITGSGGANDVVAGAREVVVALPQTRGRFVDAVPYVTAPGARVTTVVSDHGVYEKATPDGELVLTGLHGDGDEAALVAATREACGWKLRVANTLRRFAPPTADELRLVRLFDPRRYFLGEAPS